MSKQLSASSENYLRAIFAISQEKQVARVKDISKFLGIGPSSVSEALRNLSDKGFINYEPYGVITLNEQGQEIVKEITKRHNIILNFLENVLVVDPENAEENACKIEYGVSNDVLEKFVMFLEFMQTCSCKEPKWMKSFKYYSNNGKLQEKCVKCIALSKENPEAMNNRNCCGMIQS